MTNTNSGSIGARGVLLCPGAKLDEWQESKLRFPIAKSAWKRLGMAAQPSRTTLSLLLWPLLLLAPTTTAQTPKDKPADDHQKHVEEFSKSLSDLQVEFRADIQLTAIEARKVANQKLVREILNDLIESADEAKFPYKVISEDREQPTRQHEIERALAFLNVDALSIKTRAIRSLMTRDREEALRDFQDLRLSVPAVACKSAMVPDIHDYYQLFTAIGNATLGVNPKSREQFLLWTSGRIQGITSPVELLPAVNALLDLNLSANEFERLSDALTLKLGTLVATDREMYVLESQSALSNGLERLAHRLQEESWPVSPLIVSYKAFLERSAKQPVCGDITTDWKSASDSYFRISKEFDPGTPAKVDFYALRRSAERGGAAEVEVLPGDPSMYNGISKVMERRSAERRGDSTSTVNSAFAGWESDVADSLKIIDALDPSQAPCPACVFSVKSSLLFLYFDAMPPGDWKDKVLDRLASVLADESIEKKYPAEWLIRAYALLDMARAPSPAVAEQLRRLEKEGKHLIGLPSDYGSRIRDSLRRTGNRTLNSYVDADELLQYQYVIPAGGA